MISLKQEDKLYPRVSPTGKLQEKREETALCNWGWSCILQDLGKEREGR